MSLKFYMGLGIGLAIFVAFLFWMVTWLIGNINEKREACESLGGQYITQRGDPGICIDKTIVINVPEEKK